MATNKTKEIEKVSTVEYLIPTLSPPTKRLKENRQQQQLQQNHQNGDCNRSFKEQCEMKAAPKSGPKSGTRRMSFSLGSPRMLASRNRAIRGMRAPNFRGTRNCSSRIPGDPISGAANVEDPQEDDENSDDNENDSSSESDSYSEEEIPEAAGVESLADELEKGTSASKIEECIIDLFDDDEEDCNYHNMNPLEMWCEVCNHTFKLSKNFISHHRRHRAKDHFQCPTCFVGFTTLKGCLNHEIKVHNKKALQVITGPIESQSQSQSQGQSQNQSQSDRIVQSSTNTDNENTNQSSSSEANYFQDQNHNNVVNPDMDDEEENSSRVIPSTCASLYRGPPVDLRCEAFVIEEKYGYRGYITDQMDKIRAGGVIEEFDSEDGF